jgi:class 3 adenylate cyclase
MPACPGCGAANPEPARFCSECGRRLRAPDRPDESRRIVTVLFSDVVGSTGMGEDMDAETVRSIMARYFAVTSRVIERNGGTVEKFIGDAVMAVFGLPAVHEDDASRAIRAAVGMRAALADLNEALSAELGVVISARIGIASGEVVAGDSTVRQSPVTGDAVNTAARLQQAAAPGEILVADSTRRLAPAAAVVEEVEPLVLKGKADPVTAARIIGLRAEDSSVRRLRTTPIQGRQEELALLRRTVDDVVARRRSALVTLVGPAGVGKSRIVGAILGELEGPCPGARGSVSRVRRRRRPLADPRDPLWSGRDRHPAPR